MKSSDDDVQADERAQEIRGVVLRERAAGPSVSGTRYSRRTREAAVSYAREALGRGVGARRIAKALGLDSRTFYRWVWPEGVRPEDAERARRVGSSLVFVTPLGYRVEGLTLNEVSALLAQVGMIRQHSARNGEPGTAREARGID